MQNAPLAMNGATPCLGIAWSPDKKEKWQLHAHIGLFTGQYGTSDYAELQREDGIHRITSPSTTPSTTIPSTARPPSTPSAKPRRISKTSPSRSRT
jgi:hypothetical protein